MFSSKKIENCKKNLKREKMGLSCAPKGL